MSFSKSTSTTISTDNINSVALINTKAIAASGGNRGLYYSTDSGVTWTRSNITSLNFSSDIKKGLNGLANNSISSLAMSNQIMHFISFLIKYFLLHSNLYQLLNYSFYT